MEVGQVIFSLTAPSLQLQLKFEFRSSDAIFFMKLRLSDCNIHRLLFIMKYDGNFSGGHEIRQGTHVWVQDSMRSQC